MPLPQKGSPEFDLMVQAQAEGRARNRALREQGLLPPTKSGRLKGKARPKLKPKIANLGTESPAGEGTIDVGIPSPVAMEGLPQKPAESKRRQRKEEFDEGEIAKNIGLGLDLLASVPGHEHWHRDTDEVALISEPAARCLNRLDPEMRAKMREMSDPVALVIACLMVLGPSIAKEIADVRGNRHPAKRNSQPQESARNGASGASEAYSAPVPSGGAQPIPGVAGIPAVGN